MKLARIKHIPESLRKQFLEARNDRYRTDPEWHAARLDNLEYTVQAMLEMLRDKQE